MHTISALFMASLAVFSLHFRLKLLPRTYSSSARRVAATVPTNNQPHA